MQDCKRNKKAKIYCRMLSSDDDSESYIIDLQI